jgi:hypothetical protein
MDTETYTGTLQMGRRYQAEIDFDPRLGYTLTIPAVGKTGHDIKIEWRGLEHGKMQRSRYSFLFTVLSESSTPVRGNRWITNVACRVLRADLL